LVDWNRFDQLDDARHFMQRQALATELADLLAREIRIRHDGRGDDFTASAGRFAVNLYLTHAVDLQNDLFDLARVHLLAGRVDQVARATGKHDLAVVASLDE